jgi:hypothetical protein
MILKKVFKSQYPSGPVTASVGDFLPRTRVKLIYILFYGVCSAALRAAQGYRFSADPQLEPAAAFFAFHIWSPEFRISVKLWPELIL